MERGRAEGRAEGEIQKALNIARNMKKDGVDPKVIAKYTGMSLDEIEQLDLDFLKIRTFLSQTKYYGNKA